MVDALRLGWVLLLAVSSLACTQAAGEPGAAAFAAPPQVTRGDLAVRMLLTGELVAEDAALLVAPNANVWPLQIRWLAEAGDEVRAGDRVVEFDNSQLVSNLEEMRVQAISAATRLDSLRAQTASEEAQAVFDLEQSRGKVEKARLEVEAARLEAPIKHERKVLELRRAELELEQARNKLDAERRANRAEIDIQRIALEKAREEVARSEAGIELLTLRAPRDGILILANNSRQGRLYQAGDNIWPGRTVARLPDLDTLLIEARLFDVDDGRIAPGMAVSATLDAFPDQVWSGRVREVDRMARDSDRQSLRRYFRTLIDLERVDPERMRPGMSVKVVIEETYEGRLLVPRRSLDWSGGEARALLADGSWTAVTLGPCSVEACTVAEGLDESTRLAVVEGAVQAP